MKGLIGKKIGMTQIYNEQGVLIPVTVIEAGPCVVTAVKTVESDGYDAVQLGYGSRKSKNVTAARRGHLAKAGITGVEIAAQIIRECRPYCQGVHIMALGWEAKVPELLKLAGI